MVSEYMRTEILSRHSDGDTTEEIAEEFGLSKQVVAKVLKGEKQHEKQHEQDKGENASLKNTINNFRSKGCSIPRCPKCKGIMSEVKDNPHTGDLHYKCPACDYVDWKDKLCNNSCCKRGLKLLAEQKGYDVTDTEEEEEEDDMVCPWCKGDLYDLGGGKYQCSECGRFSEDE